ncbi:MAG: hypothetical protein CMP98_13055 [Gammaproteobacteria bacterium]|nr:hypothetical protein [Gammaproteobacteria bacterium]OUU07129.1 MAG: hypothetical protein CBB94_13745 [Gammaproteobacteria bacterium TMED34]
MTHRETIAKNTGAIHQSLIVASEHFGAHALCLRLGYQDFSSLP